jgi:uncharacterized protein (TIGR01777 family)
MRVLITGATGFVGKVLVCQLLERGVEVVVLTSNFPKAALTLGRNCRYFQWNDTKTLPPLEAFDGVDAVINLMGENIAAKPWSEEQKKKIYDSRIDGTAKLVEAIEKLEKRPNVFVSTSAVGIYGNRGDEQLSEQSTLANDFLAEVCKDWEKEALRSEKLGCRVVIIRTGVVLGKGGGALAKMLPIFKTGLGGPLGSGSQFMSWIHVEDLAALYIECLMNQEARGAFNGTAPYPATNKDFSKTLGKVLKRPAFMPAPAFAIKAVLGEMSSILLGGQRVLPVKSKDLKFRFTYPTLDLALKEAAR